MPATKMTAQEIIQFIADAKKKTNVKVTFEGKLAGEVPNSVVKLGNVLFGDWEKIKPLLVKDFDLIPSCFCLLFYFFTLKSFF